MRYRVPCAAKPPDLAFTLLAPRLLQRTAGGGLELQATGRQFDRAANGRGCIALTGGFLDTLEQGFGNADSDSDQAMLL